MRALTDPASIDLRHMVPHRVPSGLPVWDQEITGSRSGRPLTGSSGLPEYSQRRLARVGRMRREELFSRSGFYGFLLESNVLLHREAARVALDAFRPVVLAQGSKPVSVLDLACGGWPVTIAEVMAAFPHVEFQYTGIDINPDQVALAANRFPFPENVVGCRIVEGNAWDLSALDVDDRYSIAFSGMNLHHGTPREVWFLGNQLKGRIQPGGLFFSHDVYRPDSEPYRPRPETIDGESTRLVEPDRLASAGAPTLHIEQDRGVAEPAWRIDYVQRMYRTLLARGADPAGAESTASHMRSRDYPLSTGEFCNIMESHGFIVHVRRYDASPEPLGPFVASCALTRPARAINP